MALLLSVLVALVSRRDFFLLRSMSLAVMLYALGGGGGGVLLHNCYTGMCRPTGSYFWDSDLERGIILEPFSRTGYNFSNA